MSRLLHYSSSVSALLKYSLLQTPTLIYFLSVAVLIYILKSVLSHPCYVNERKWTGVVPKVYKRDLILSVFHSVIHVDQFDQISQVLLCRSSFVPPLSRYYLNRYYTLCFFLFNTKFRKFYFVEAPSFHRSVAITSIGYGRYGRFYLCR